MTHKTLNSVAAMAALGAALFGGAASTQEPNAPGIVGRSPIYIARQLWDIKAGVRAGPAAALMRAVVANLTDANILQLAAYAASLDP